MGLFLVVSFDSYTRFSLDGFPSRPTTTHLSVQTRINRRMPSADRSEGHSGRSSGNGYYRGAPNRQRR